MWYSMDGNTFPLSFDLFLIRLQPILGFYIPTLVACSLVLLLNVTLELLESIL